MTPTTDPVAPIQSVLEQEASLQPDTTQNKPLTENENGQSNEKECHSPTAPGLPTSAHQSNNHTTNTKTTTNNKINPTNHNHTAQTLTNVAPHLNHTILHTSTSTIKASPVQIGSTQHNAFNFLMSSYELSWPHYYHGIKPGVTDLGQKRNS